MGDSFATQQDCLNFYKELINIYKSSSDTEGNKHTILEQIRQKFRQYGRNQNQNQDTLKNLYYLKVLLETQFMRDVDCSYTYLFTPDKYGCDLRELVFNIESEANRQQLLADIRQASDTQTQIPHILTDIDDTLFPNFKGYNEISGSDTSWKSHEPYPGLKKFYEIFHRNIQQPEARYTTVLTGTPTFLKHARLSNGTLKNILGPNFGFIQGFDKKRHAIQALLRGIYEGSFSRLVVSSDAVADIKYEKFKQYRALFPEYKLLFIGDNGQGDLIAGHKMLAADPTAYVFIHNILKHKTHFHFTDTREREETSKPNALDRLFFFKNYLELGYIFNKLEYFSNADFAELKVACRRDLKSGLSTICDIKNIDACKDKHLYTHYTCPSIMNSPKSCITTKNIITDPPKFTLDGASRKTRKTNAKARKTRRAYVR
jgi:hypothetical protein